MGQVADSSETRQDNREYSWLFGRAGGRWNVMRQYLLRRVTELCSYYHVFLCGDSLRRMVIHHIFTKTDYEMR